VVFIAGGKSGSDEIVGGRVVKKTRNQYQNQFKFIEDFCYIYSESYGGSADIQLSSESYTVYPLREYLCKEAGYENKLMVPMSLTALENVPYLRFV
jgi:hypothetical protein